ANEFDLRAFLCLTGDPIKLGDCTQSKGVFEENSLKLTHIINELNAGRVVNGKELQSPIKRIYSFQVINAYANNLQSLKTKMRKKISQGRPQALFTQPVYSMEVAEFLLKSLEELNAEYGTDTTLIFGFFPVVSYKVALFLRDKLPGVFIPQSWIARLESAKENEYEVGMELSREVLAGLRGLHDKIHFMSANKPELAREFYTS
ncbi:methylenetetrahydrofolate reductase, partial [uncultured Helicobacter sp.]|uniref:methylenetetrahydrofolate reductase n=1 Tax=uncultured Helicobacter sp. TaxID=175537 RepID=UPI00374F516A